MTVVEEASESNKRPRANLKREKKRYKFVVSRVIKKRPIGSNLGKFGVESKTR